jgi:16S rRNA (cytosine967-C5)-methyltransferase
MVNAILRKIAASAKTVHVAEEAAYSEWMLRRWKKNYGSGAVRKICAAGQQEPPATLRLVESEAEAELLAAGIELAPGVLLTKARNVIAGDAASTGAVREGRAQFQDEGSQLVAELLGAGERIAGARILDCCAAPGGKTAILLEKNPKSKIFACDASAVRLKAMQQRLDRPQLRDRIEYLVADASQLPEIGHFDRILCDVPCSGTGTLSRNPEIRHRIGQEELARHAQRQRGILSSALEKLAPGGRLLYATCSLEPEENEDVVQAVLEEKTRQRKEFVLADLHAEFQLLQQQGTVQGAAAIHFEATAFRNGFLRTLPGVHACDGFFAALIERKTSRTAG